MTAASPARRQHASQVSSVGWLVQTGDAVAPRVTTRRSGPAVHRAPRWTEDTPDDLGSRAKPARAVIVQLDPCRPPDGAHVASHGSAGQSTWWTRARLAVRRGRARCQRLPVGSRLDAFVPFPDGLEVCWGGRRARVASRWLGPGRRRLAAVGATRGGRPATSSPGHIRHLSLTKPSQSCCHYGPDNCVVSFRVFQPARVNSPVSARITGAFNSVMSVAVVIRLRHCSEDFQALTGACLASTACAGPYAGRLLEHNQATWLWTPSSPHSL